MSHAEQQFRAEAAKAALKIAALDWLDAAARNVPKGHRDSCNYLDDTGWPAPCSCGFAENKEAKIVQLLKDALMKP